MSGTARRLGAWTLQAIGPHVRSEVLERTTEATITVTPISGGHILFHTPSPLLIARAESVLSKEADTIRWIEGFESSAVFWDIGANVGVYSLYAALRRDVKVLAFEPSAANFQVLSRNIQLNQLSGRVTAYCLAFSKQTQLGVLNLASPKMGAALSQFGHPAERSRYCDEEGQIENHGMVGFSLDDFIEQFDPPFPTALKMDVDGLELPILEGASKTLRDSRLQLLMVELSVTRKDENGSALSLLEEAGFKFISRGEIQGTKTESAANHFFHRVPSPVLSNLPLCNAESVGLAR